MSAYVALRDALFALVAELDISSTFPEDVDAADAVWKVALDRPRKGNEMTAYPAFLIQPLRDIRATADTETDFSQYTFWLSIHVLWNDATDNEAQITALVEIVNQALINERMSDAPLGGLCHNLIFNGLWSGDETQGERIYRLEITCFVDESSQPLPESDPEPEPEPEPEPDIEPDD